MSEFNEWTQTVHVHFGNTEYHRVMMMVERIAEQEPDDPITVLKDRLMAKYDTTDISTDLCTNCKGLDHPSPLVRDLLRSALDRVDWYGLALTFEEDFEDLGGVKGSGGAWTWEVEDD